MDISLKPIDQQVIVITGASSGIGLATAYAAATQGARVVLAARSHATLDQIVSYIQQHGGQAVAVAADVGDRAQVERIAAVAIERYGRIDTWVNNAGVGFFGRLDETSDADAQRLFLTNYWGVVYGSQVALPFLRSHGGALINVGSEVSEAVVPLQGMYSASKHAVKGYTDALRLEMQVDQAPVSVTLIQPTAVDTLFAEHAGTSLSQEPKLPTPMIEPEKVASAILDAAATPTPAIKVGAMAKLNTALAELLPGLFGKMAKAQLGRQQRDEAPHAPAGTLYTAGESGRTRGRGSEHPAEPKEAAHSNVRPA